MRNKKFNYLENDLTTFEGVYGVRKKYWIGTAIGAGLGLASSIIGGIQSADANAKAEKEMKAQNARNEAWYNRRYNEDYADTAAGQNLMRQAKEYANENWKKAQGASAVGGGTDAASALAKEQGNKMIGNTLGNIAAADTQLKMNVDDRHMQNQNNYSKQLVALAQNKANNIAKTASSTSNALLQAGSAFDQYSGTTAVKSSTGSVANEDKK